MVYTIAGSFAANLWLTNNSALHLCPALLVWANPWVYTDKYNRPHCICTLLNDGLSTFPAYLTSTGCISFPAPSLVFVPILLNFAQFITRWWLLVRSSFVVLWLLWCFRTVLGDMSHFSAIVAHWSSLLTNGLYVIHLSFILEISRRAWKVVASKIHTVHFLLASAQLSWLHSRMHQSSLMLVPLQIPSTMVSGHIWKACIASSVARSGNATTMLSN